MTFTVSEQLKSVNIPIDDFEDDATDEEVFFVYSEVIVANNISMINNNLRNVSVCKLINCEQYYILTEAFSHRRALPLYFTVVNPRSNANQLAMWIQVN